jgi:DNA mismatch repair protein MutS2
VATAFAAGDPVQTAFGKGIVREVRNQGRVLVEVQGRALLFEAAALTHVAGDRKRPARLRASARPARPPAPDHTHRVRDLDLHGLTVDEAMARVDSALDAAMRADVAELRVIHGRGGGRLRAALHRRLAGIPTVRAFALDPRNEGVTVVRL